MKASFGCVAREGGRCGDLGGVWSREALLELVVRRLDWEARLGADGRLELWAEVDKQGRRIRKGAPEGAVPKRIRAVSSYGDGRAVAVLLSDGTVQRGSEVDERYVLKSSNVVEYRGIEVRSDTVNGSGEVIIDEHGKPCWQPSDMGSGGHTLHRLSGPDARWRIRVQMDDGTEHVHLFPTDIENKRVALVIYGRLPL